MNHPLWERSPYRRWLWWVTFTRSSRPQVGHFYALISRPEGIETARDFRPSFVLLDIGLPGMDGYEVAAQLRREVCCKESVIIAVSGYGQDEDRRRSKEAGFHHHLIKPLDHDALITLLATSTTRPA